MKLKTLPFLLFLSCALHYGYSQNFCGHIKYRYTYYQPKNNKDITAAVDDFKTEDFYICGNNFKVYFDGVLKDIFIGDSLTYFHVRADSTIGYLKADSAYGQPVPEYIRHKDRVTYKGNQYQVVESNEDGDKTRYYFKDEIRIDAQLFRELSLYHWNTFFNATGGGLRLVFIDVTKDLKTVAEAVQIEQLQLSDQDFELPKGYKIQPYGLFEILK